MHPTGLDDGVYCDKLDLFRPNAQPQPSCSPCYSEPYPHDKEACIFYRSFLQVFLSGEWYEIALKKVINNNVKTRKELSCCRKRKFSNRYMLAT